RTQELPVTSATPTIVVGGTCILTCDIWIDLTENMIFLIFHSIFFCFIMFCTRNTHKLDMEKLLCYEIGLNDFLFAHIQGQPKEIKIRKTSESFGLTLTDNGCGVVIIKRLQPNGLMDRVSKACGDQIEKINDISFTGKRHYHVAGYLQTIPIGGVFCLRLISPEPKELHPAMKHRRPPKLLVAGNKAGKDRGLDMRLATPTPPVLTTSLIWEEVASASPSGLIADEISVREQMASFEYASLSRL
ncbi:unnamed protein product, partial [Trichobilharzia regenti]